MFRFLLLISSQAMKPWEGVGASQRTEAASHVHGR